MPKLLNNQWSTIQESQHNYIRQQNKLNKQNNNQDVNIFSKSTYSGIQSSK